MTERRYTRIIIESSQPVKHYSEEETARYSNLDVEVIRRLRTVGLSRNKPGQKNVIHCRENTSS